MCIIVLFKYICYALTNNFHASSEFVKCKNDVADGRGSRNRRLYEFNSSKIEHPTIAQDMCIIVLFKYICYALTNNFHASSEFVKCKNDVADGRGSRNRRLYEFK
ncbi:uncharacterized protein LOC119686207 [Teleopsis dalmanni]|uniref:uncharacterized protein LOC119665574 n=1 Tax=Teleopsis dalmanni TaxID=139649 RepID=UPI0018CF033E|nr:uncharacterized protein LOC119665574 [Teleopsis dalmanni]XP_037947403.1 uncharacterized protein LOC119679243 [Teleopsis dalmanni]XP_037956646.1 uncharacterized protein LOC119686207 [Teleopsis dalmanni]